MQQTRTAPPGGIGGRMNRVARNSRRGREGEGEGGTGGRKRRWQGPSEDCVLANVGNARGSGGEQERLLVNAPSSPYAHLVNSMGGCYNWPGELQAIGAGRVMKSHAASTWQAWQILPTRSSIQR